MNTFVRPGVITGNLQRAFTMKKLLTLIVCVATLSGAARATEIGAPAAGAPLTAGELERLVAPVALYPDPLLALILPAATRPSDIVLAARYVERGGDPNAVDAQPWEDSVRALVRYREVLVYLDDNLEWTRSLGDAFLDQREDVMAAIQTLRARAHEQGLLSSSSQQEVLIESEEIRIVPAQPTVIYVPRYDPEILYVRYVHPYPYSYWHRPFITFGIGYNVGWWLSYDFDWRYRTVYVVHRPSYWYHRPDWRVRYVHRDRYPDHRWTHWSPRPDRRQHHVYSGRTASAQVTAHGVVEPQRVWNQSQVTRTPSPTDPRRDGSRQHSVSRPGEWNGRDYRTGERDAGRRGDRVTRPAPLPQPVTAPQVASTAPIVSAPQVVTQPTPRAGGPRDSTPGRRDHGSAPSWTPRATPAQPAAAPPPSRPAPETRAAPPPERSRRDDDTPRSPRADQGGGNRRAPDRVERHLH